MRLNLILIPLSILLIISCAHRARPVTQNQATPLPKQGSNELKNLIAEVDSEIDNISSGSETTPEIEQSKHDIPLEVNEKVEKWLQFFTVKDRERFQRFLNRGESYRVDIQKTLKENDVPEQLFYQAMIESGFSMKARSSANAVGPWQFIKGTGRRYGLKVTHYVDERQDPVRATLAASKYLKDLHNVFQSWYLAMAAYNAGERRIMSAIMKANSRDFWELVEKKALPRETMNYVPKFIAATIIGRHPERFGFKVVKTKEVPKLIAKSVPSRTKLSDIARTLKIPYAVLKDLNPHILRNIIPSHHATYEIWLPEAFKHNFLNFQSKLAKLPKVRTSRRSIASRRSSSSNGSYRTHRVRSGDTLARISKKYNLTLNYLKRINNLRSSRIYVGKRLKLTRQKSSSRYVSRTKAKRYKVRKGDNLTKISKKFGVSIGLLKRLNRIRRNRVYIGQVLKIQQKG